MPDGMDELARAKMTNEVIQAYLALGDTLRVAALPGWISAELTLSQLKAMFLLAHHGALTVSELARKLDTGNPAASILVQQLVQHGMVERSQDAKDRRRTFVRPTARGADLITSRRESMQANLGRWLGQLGDEELAGLQAGLAALRRAAREADSE